MTLSLSTLAATLLIPAVVTVDDTPGQGADFATIQAAIDAAQDGDTILIAGGSYPGFTADGRALSLVARPGESVEVTGPAIVREVPAGGGFLLQGLDFAGAETIPLGITQNDGLVSVEHCSAIPTDLGQFGLASAGIAIGNSADVRLLSVTARGQRGDPEIFLAATAKDGAAAVRITESTVVLADADFRGGDGGNAAILGILDAGQGAPAIRTGDNSQVTVLGGLLEGGEGGYADFCDCPGGLICGDPGNGGAAFENVGPQQNSVIEVFDAQLIGGEGSSSVRSDCSDGLPGLPFSGLLPANVTLTPGAHRVFQTQSPATDGGTAELSLVGEPGDVVLIVVGSPSAPLPIPGFLGALYAGAPQILFSGAASPALAALSLPIAPKPAGFEALEATLQGVAITSSLEVRLLAPGTLVVVDDAL